MMAFRRRPRIIRPLLQQLQSSGIPVLLMCEPQAHSLFPLASWQLCAPLDSVSAYDSYASVNSLINLLANAFLHEILDKGRPRIHEIATLYQHRTSSNNDNGASVWCFALKWCSEAGRKESFFAPPLFYQALQQNPAFRFIWHISCKIQFKESFVSC